MAEIIFYTNLSETEIAEKVVKRTFLSELEVCLAEQYFRDADEFPRKTKALVQERYSKVIEFVDQFVPVGWHYGAISAEQIVPESFKAKLSKPSAHNRQHYGFVGNNTIIGAAYDPVLSSLSRQDRKDSGMVLPYVSFTHDDNQIDREIKDGHDYIGGLFGKGLMRIARVKYGLPYTERQEDLAMYAGYGHSYPEKMPDQLPPAKKILADWGPQFGLYDSTSLLFWWNSELNSIGVSPESLNCNIRSGDRLAKWNLFHIFHGDKRASYAPPLMSLFRTMGTNDQPFIGEEFIGKDVDFFMKHISAKNVVARSFYEDGRDLQAAGFTAFQINWLKINQVKKLDYLVKIANGMCTGNMSLVKLKFFTYARELIDKSYNENRLTYKGKNSLEYFLPVLLENGNFSILESGPEDLSQTIKLVCHDYQNARGLMIEKGTELRKYLNKKGWSNDQFMDWFKLLVDEVKANSEFKLINRHQRVPENLPVYCASLGVIN